MIETSLSLELGKLVTENSGGRRDGEVFMDFFVEKFSNGVVELVVDELKEGLTGFYLSHPWQFLTRLWNF